MLHNEITDKIIITNLQSGESIELEQRNVHVREDQNKIMAISYKAPIFDTIDLERFFDNISPSDKFSVNIGGTGEFNVNFRGIIDGKQKNFSQNMDHKILLLEEHKCPTRVEIKRVKPTSKFVPRGALSK